MSSDDFLVDFGLRRKYQKYRCDPELFPSNDKIKEGLVYRLPKVQAGPGTSDL